MSRTRQQKEAAEWRKIGAKIEAGTWAKCGLCLERCKARWQSSLDCDVVYAMSDRLDEHLNAWYDADFDRHNEVLYCETKGGSYFDKPGVPDARILACELLALEAESE
jgi:hypothetical protein